MIFLTAEDRSAVSSIIEVTFPCPTPIAGVPLIDACFTLFKEPVTITKFTLDIKIFVNSFVTGQSKVWTRFSGAFSFFNSLLIEFNKLLKTLDPAGDGEIIIEFLHFRALIMLLVGVAAGFVDGVTAPTTPIGFAISIIPLILSSLITPIVLTFLISLNNPSVFLLFFKTLSLALPSPVSFTAWSEIFSLLEGLHKAQATPVTISSIFS